MFWNFMHNVHNLPEYEDRESEPWWTEEEQTMLKLVQHQLSYMRITPEGEKPADLPLAPVDGQSEVEQIVGPCFGPDAEVRNGEVVFCMSPTYVKFFEEHLGLGKYTGTVTIEGQPVWWDEVNGAPILSDVADGTRYSYGETIEPDDDETPVLLEVVVDGKVVGYEPECDEPGDIEVVFCFEKGSIAYAHYGRGAGLSVRLWSSLTNEDGKLIDAESGVEYEVSEALEWMQEKAVA